MKSERLLALFAISIAISASAQVSTPQRLYQTALLEMEAKGDYEQAITLFNKILESKSTDRSLLARTHLQLGKCYEKLGNREAIRSYEAVISRFADQHDATREARARLNELRKRNSSVNTNGMTIKKLEIPIGHMESPTPSPDERMIAYWRKQPLSKSVLLVYHAETREVQELADCGEGSVTWVCWSPDGKKIAYSYVVKPGFVQTQIVTVQTGKIDTLISIPGAALFPIDWSQSGEEILLVKRDSERMNKIGVINLYDRKYRDLSTQYSDQIDLQNGYPRLSLDGKYYVSRVSVGKNTALKVFAVDGSSSKTIRDTLYSSTYPIWSMSGTFVLFLHIREGINDLMVIRMKNGTPIGDPFLLKSDIGPSIVLRTISNHGRLYYEQKLRWQSIFTVEIDTQTLQAKSSPKVHGDNGVNNFLAAWSPSGSSMFYFSQRLSSPRRIGGSLPWRLFISPGLERHEEEIDLGSYYPYRFVVSPDSEYIFLEVSDPRNRQGIYALHLRDRIIEDLVLDSVFQCGSLTWNIVGWRSTTKELLFACQSDSANARRMNIYRIGLHDSIPKYLTEFDGETPVLSPNGNEFVYIHNARGTIEVQSLATEETRILVYKHNPKVMFQFPSWSPDGKRILYNLLWTRRDTLNEIRCISATGGEEVTILAGSAELSRPYDARWSPDGKRIAFTALLESQREYWVMENFLPKP